MDVINLSGTDASGIEDQNVIPPPASDLIYELKSKKSKTLVHFFSVHHQDISIVYINFTIYFELLIH